MARNGTYYVLAVQDVNGDGPTMGDPVGIAINKSFYGGDTGDLITINGANVNNVHMYLFKPPYIKKQAMLKGGSTWEDDDLYVTVGDEVRIWITIMNPWVPEGSYSISNWNITDFLPVGLEYNGSSIQITCSDMPGGWDINPAIWDNRQSLSWEANWEISSGTAMHIYFYVNVTSATMLTNTAQINGIFNGVAPMYLMDTVNIWGAP